MGEEDTRKYLKKFAIILGAVLTLTLTFVAVTPLSDIWFQVVSGLSDKLTSFSKLPLMIMSIFPALTLLISYQRAILVHKNFTTPITLATIIEFSIIVIFLFIAINTFNLVGAVAATASLVLGRISSNIYLTFPILKILKRKD
jgi:O-antigen/teichoic acid export membrane protein